MGHATTSYRVQVVGIILLLVRFLRCSLRLRLQEPLLQHQCLLDILFTESIEGLVKPWNALALTSPVAFDSSSESINNGLPLGW